MTPKQRLKKDLATLVEIRKDIAEIEPRYLALIKVRDCLEQLIALDEPICEIHVKPDVFQMVTQ